MNYGYIRPIVQDEEGTEQLKSLSLHKIYREAHGLAKKRVELERVLMHMQKGDALFVQNIPVIADSLQDVIDLLRLAKRDQITIHFIDEKVTSNSVEAFSLLEGTLFFTQLQSALLSHSSTFTLREAKKEGRPVGRPRKSDDNLQKAFSMYDSNKYSLFDIKEVTGISKSTLYRYLDERSNSTLK